MPQYFKKQVKSQKEILLVIGNGFDLHLGLKTSYNDFFNWTKGEDNDDLASHREKAKRDYSCFIKLKEGIQGLKGADAEPLLKEFTHNVHLPFWLLMFWLLSLEKEEEAVIPWNKIEGVMTASLSKEGYKGFKWKRAYANISHAKQGRPLVYKDTASILAGIFLHLEEGDIPVGYYDDGLYSSFTSWFLRPHLYRFEKLFGRYITTVQLVNYDDYLEKAGALIEKIVGTRGWSYRKAPKKVYIDSFNYLDLSGWSLTSNSKGFTYIHGNSISPIFGVKRPESKNDESYCFTKAYLRPDPLCPAQESPNAGRDIKEVHIYGHSLSTVDSPYFEELFYMMGLYDPALCEDKKIYIDYSDVQGEDPKASYEKRLDRLDKYLDYARKNKHLPFPSLKELMEKEVIVFRKID